MTPRGEFLVIPDNFELFTQETCTLCGANRLWLESDVRGRPKHTCLGDGWVYPDFHPPIGGLDDEEGFVEAD